MKSTEKKKIRLPLRINLFHIDEIMEKTQYIIWFKIPIVAVFSIRLLKSLCDSNEVLCFGTLQDIGIMIFLPQMFFGIFTNVSPQSNFCSSLNFMVYKSLQFTLNYMANFKIQSTICSCSLSTVEAISSAMKMTDSLPHFENRLICLMRNMSVMVCGEKG